MLGVCLKRTWTAQLARCIGIVALAQLAIRCAAPAPQRGDTTTQGRIVIDLADGWRFHLSDVQDAEQPDFDDSAWDAVTLPHTWNAQDGQDGPSTAYYRGIGWYRTHWTPPDSLGDRTIY